MGPTYSERVFEALDIQHAMRICHMFIRDIYHMFIRDISTLSHKRHGFRKTAVAIRTCVYILSLNFV